VSQPGDITSNVAIYAYFATGFASRPKPAMMDKSEMMAKTKNIFFMTLQGSQIASHQ